MPFKLNAIYGILDLVGSATGGTGDPSLPLNSVQFNDGGVFGGFGKIDTVLENTFLGVLSGDNNVGSDNVGVGSQALQYNLDGTYNTAVGQLALNQNTYGGGNVAVGQAAMANNIDSGNNTALGCDAMLLQVSGGANVAIGYSVMRGDFFNTNTCVANVMIGQNAGYKFDIADFNTGIGYGALQRNVYGNNNVAIGAYSGNWATSSNKFYLNNVDQGYYGNDSLYSLLYGEFAGVAGTTSGNLLQVNGIMQFNGNTEFFQNIQLQNLTSIKSRHTSLASFDWLKYNSNNETLITAYNNIILTPSVGTIQLAGQTDVGAYNFSVDTNTLFVDATNNRVGFKIATPLAVLHLQNDTSDAMSIYDKISSDTAGPVFQYRKARGSIGSLSAITTADVILNIGGFGYDGTTYNLAASAAIRVFAAQNWSSGVRGNYMTFATTAIGGSTQAERLRINENGLGITSVQTTTNGLTGTAISSQPFSGATYKKFMIFLTNFTSAGTVLTFPVAFVKAPFVYGDAAAVAIAVTTTTTCTLTAVGATAGNIFIEGY